jgi:PHS family inorganic phosphate transporter-like MFS transporter
MYGLELILIIFATVAQALSAHSPACSIVGVIVFWRVLMGIGKCLLPIKSLGVLQADIWKGIGGDYPLSSIITSEFATTKWRGAMMGSVFAMQGIGQFAAAMVSLIVTAAFKSSLETAKTVDHCGGACNVAVDKMWRIVIGFGAVPGCIGKSLYVHIANARLTLPQRFTIALLSLKLHDIPLTLTVTSSKAAPISRLSKPANRRVIRTR